MRATGTDAKNNHPSPSRWPKERVEYWHLWVQIFAGTIGVIGVLLLVWQLRQSNMQLNQAEQAIRSDTIGQIYNHMVEVDRLFVDHPELKPYFYEGKRIGDPNPLLEDPVKGLARHHAQVDATAELIADFFSEALQGVVFLPEDTYEGWCAYIKYVYKQSPPLQELYQQRIDWYRNEVAGQLFEKAQHELDTQIHQDSPADRQCPPYTQ